MVLKISLPVYRLLVLVKTYRNEDSSVVPWGATDIAMKRMTFLCLPPLPPPIQGCRWKARGAAVASSSRSPMVVACEPRKPPATGHRRQAGSFLWSLSSGGSRAAAGDQKNPTQKKKSSSPECSLASSKRESEAASERSRPPKSIHSTNMADLCTAVLV